MLLTYSYLSIANKDYFYFSCLKLSCPNQVFNWIAYLYFLSITFLIFLEFDRFYSMKPFLSLFDKIAMPVLGTATLILFVMETRQQLRKRKQNRLEHIKTNAGVAAIGLMGLRGALLPAMVAGGKWSHQKGFGLVQKLPLPAVARTALALLLLDYSNYVWHHLNHQSP